MKAAIATATSGAPSSSGGTRCSGRRSDAAQDILVDTSCGSVAISAHCDFAAVHHHSNRAVVRSAYWSPDPAAPPCLAARLTISHLITPPSPPPRAAAAGRLTRRSSPRHRVARPVPAAHPRLTGRAQPRLAVAVSASERTNLPSDAGLLHACACALLRPPCSQPHSPSYCDAWLTRAADPSPSPSRQTCLFASTAPRRLHPLLRLRDLRFPTRHHTLRFGHQPLLALHFVSPTTTSVARAQSPVLSLRPDHLPQHP